MARRHTVRFEGLDFTARSGQLLLDAALIGGADIPHDCRSGRCGACLTRIRSGITLDGQSHQPGYVHACKARVFSDLAIEVEATPEICSVDGSVKALRALGHDVVEVTIVPRSPLVVLPGQYCRFGFRGFPARAYSPTSELTRLSGDGPIRLNIKRVRGGLVSSALGSRIKIGHAVGIEGPFGHAFHRAGQTNRLIMIGTGTGFAPVWAVTVAALKENAKRSIVVLAGARNLRGLYMAPALGFASRYPGVSVLACVSEMAVRSGAIVPGSPGDHLPGDLGRRDTIFVAGAPNLVEDVAMKARDVGAMLHCDPFEAQSGGDSWLYRARQWLTSSAG